MSPTDQELVQRYARGDAGAQAAFAELVQRHARLVFLVARRHVRSSALAEEVVQSVFLDLALQADRIKAGAPLVAWLHLVSQRTAVDTVRREQRRRLREQAAAAEPETSDRIEDWTVVRPVLDEALQTLPVPDRTAVLLRFFENRSLIDIGAALGVSEDAAQKRVTRALRRLRTALRRHGVKAVSFSALASSLAAQAVDPLPEEALMRVLSIAPGSTMVPTSAAVEATHLLTMSAGKPLLIAAACTVAGLGCFEYLALRSETNAVLGAHEQVAQIENERGRVQAEADRLAAELADVEADIDRLLNSAEARVENPAGRARIEEWLSQLAQIRELLESRPDLNVPELQLLDEKFWFETASMQRFSSERDIRQAAAVLRQRAEIRMGLMLQRALSAFLAGSGGRLPRNMNELVPFLDPKVQPEWLQRYETLHQGRLEDVTKQERRLSLLAVKQPADVEFDSYLQVGEFGYGFGAARFHNLKHAQDAYREAHGGEAPVVAGQLIPYLKWPMDVAIVQQMLVNDGG